MVEYRNPRKAVWPKADFVVGNPPFIGNKKMRIALGDGYVEALREAHTDVPETADFVMYWWDQAARLVRQGAVRRLGLITTNSITQAFNRQIVRSHLDATKDPLHLVFAIPDHPWGETADGAAVRIAMTVGSPRAMEGTLLTVVEETEGAEGAEVTVEGRTGRIAPDLTIGASATTVEPLRSNSGLSFMGVSLIGQGFVLDVKDPLEGENTDFIRPYIIGRDLVQLFRRKAVIDFYGLTQEQARVRAPKLYQRVLERVRPERESNNRDGYRKNWWLFGEQRSGMRRALKGLTRFIATCRTATHRIFTFVPANAIVESTVIAIALDDAFHLGVLSSRAHTDWALSAGGRLGVGNDPRYNNSLCFDPFPFPECSDALKKRIRTQADALEKHRRGQQERNAGLPLTDIYNVLEAVRRGETLSKSAKAIYEAAEVAVLKQIHDDLDSVVFEAYGWPPRLTAQQIIGRLIKENVQRVAEQKKGQVAWLRPDIQSDGDQAVIEQALMAAEPTAAYSTGRAAGTREPWPKALAEQAQAVCRVLALEGRAVSPEELARSWKGARIDRVEELLEALASLGQVRQLPDRRFVA